MDRPILWPTARVIAAFSIVFGLASLVYFLMGLDTIGIIFFLAIGAVTIVILALTTRSSIVRHYAGRMLSDGELPRVDRIINELRRTFGTPRPMVLLIPSDEPNAFAFGFGKRACLGMTQGLLTILDDCQLRACLAHEFAHIWNRDSTTRTLGIALAKTLFAFAMLLAVLIVVAGMVVVAVLLSLAGSKSKHAGRTLMIGPLAIALGVYIMSPIIISMGYFLFSRKAEYRADATSVRFTGRPSDLISALVTIDRYPLHKLSAEKHGVYSSIWSASERGRSFLENLLSSHPTAEARINRLKRIGGTDVDGSISENYVPKTTHPTNHDSRVHRRIGRPSSDAVISAERDSPPWIVDGIVTYEPPDRHTYSRR